MRSAVGIGPCPPRARYVLTRGLRPVAHQQSTSAPARPPAERCRLHSHRLAGLCEAETSDTLGTVLARSIKVSDLEYVYGWPWGISNSNRSLSRGPAYV